jgi:hypothetical protein
MLCGIFKIVTGFANLEKCVDDLRYYSQTQY